MPITPNIIQTMKHTVKPSVLTASTLQAWRVRLAVAAVGDVALPCGAVTLTMDNLLFRDVVMVGAQVRAGHPPMVGSSRGGRTMRQRAASAERTIRATG
jgi:hypothetical protein